MIRALLFGLALSAALPAVALENLTLDLLGKQASGSSYSLAVSDDGRYIVFDSAASNLLVPDSNGAIRDIYLFDRTTSSLELISVDSNGLRGSGHSRQPSISADGRYVVFESQSALAPGGSTGVSQIYLRDRQTRTTRLVSANVNGVAGDAPAYRPRISADGSLVLFDSTARNLAGSDSTAYSDVFIKHLATGEVERISSAAGGGLANGDSMEARMSGDGRFVVFVSMATNMVSPSVAVQRHVYLRDRQTGTVELVSVSSDGTPANGANYQPDVDAAGQRVVFYSLAANLAPGLSGTVLQVLVHDMATGTTRLVSATASGVGGNDHSYFASISADGNTVAFTSYANDLVDGDLNNKSDVYLRNLISGTSKLISLANSGDPANDSIVGAPSLDANAGLVVFSSYASNLVAQDINGYADVFVFQQSLNQPPLAVAGAPQTLECSGITTDVTLDGRASSDPDGDPLSFVWQGDFGSIRGAVVTVPMSVGTHSPGLLVEDGKGGQASDLTRIDIQDNVAPSLSLPARISLEAESRQGTAYTLEPKVSDACSAVGLAIAPSYAVYPLGDNRVHVTASDASGNSSSADVVVSVQDTTAPVLQVPGDIRQEALQRETVVDIGSAIATDLFDVAVSNNAPPAFPLGTTSVTWHAEDSNGNVSEASQAVTVEDTTPPVFQTVPADRVDEATAVLTPLALAPATASDIFDVSVDSDAPAAFPLGTSVVTWRATDSSGNLATAVQRVTVQDTTPPSLQAPADIVAEASGLNTELALGTPTAGDIFPVSLSNDAPAAFPLGTSVVTWQAKDSSGNTSSATQNVTVRDTTAPVLSVPADLVVEAQGPLTPVSLPAASASDIFAVSLSNNAPAMFPLGTTVVTWRAEDSNGNISTASQRITVVDTIAPEMQFQLLHETLWPPNHRMREVARVSGVSDRVDSVPQVDIDVQVVDTPSKRRPGAHQGEQRDEHEDHRSRDKSHASARRDDEHGHRGDKRRDWKVVERNGVWHVYVRARTPAFHGERHYDITVTVSDASGNRREAQGQVRIVKTEHRRR